MRDRDFIDRLIDRAKAAGCSALVLTVDLQILGQRHKDIKNEPALAGGRCAQGSGRDERCEVNG